MSIDVKAIIARGYLAAMKGDDERDFGLSEADVRMLHARQKKERERWNKMARHVVCIAADHVRRHRFSLFRQTALSPQTETFLKIIRGIYCRNNQCRNRNVSVNFCKLHS